jgi:hypothetical protein
MFNDRRNWMMRLLKKLEHLTSHYAGKKLPVAPTLPNCDHIEETDDNKLIMQRMYFEID